MSLSYDKNHYTIYIWVHNISFDCIMFFLKWNPGIFGSEDFIKHFGGCVYLLVELYNHIYVLFLLFFIFLILFGFVFFLSFISFTHSEVFERIVVKIGRYENERKWSVESFSVHFLSLFIFSYLFHCLSIFLFVFGKIGYLWIQIKKIKFVSQLPSNSMWQQNNQMIAIVNKINKDEAR